MASRNLSMQENIEFNNTMARYFNLFSTRFKWTLPHTMSARVIEDNCFKNGNLIACEHAGVLINLWSGPVNGTGISNSGMLDIYGTPRTFWAYGFNGFCEQFQAYRESLSDILNKTASQTDIDFGYNSVWERGNPFGKSYVDLLSPNIIKMAKIKQTIDILCERMRVPVFVTGSESVLENIQESWRITHEEGAPVVLSGTDILGVDTKIIPFNESKESLPYLWTLYEKLDAENKEVIGINSNVTPDKSAQVLKDEVNSGRPTVNQFLMQELMYRKSFVEKCNKLWNCNMSVELAEFSDEGQDVSMLKTIDKIEEGTT